jgi:proteasome lid subunit RPN8/RPN11
VYLPRPVDRLVVPDEIRDAVERRVERDHPVEAGGYLACRRQGSTLVAAGHVPVSNDAADPTRRFETTVDDRAPASLRVFYHSHTSASSPSGLTALDRRNIPERNALVVFAPNDPVRTLRCLPDGMRHSLLRGIQHDKQSHGKSFL